MKPEEMKAEAIRRMKKYKMLKQPIDEFDKEGVVNYSERLNAMFPAVLYWVNNDPKLVERVKEIEERTNCLVWHVILTHLRDGDMYDFLLISNDKSDWEYNEDGYELSYCDSPYASDMGTIKVKGAMGGIMRVA